MTTRFGWPGADQFLVANDTAGPAGPCDGVDYVGPVAGLQTAFYGEGNSALSIYAYTPDVYVLGSSRSGQAPGIQDTSGIPATASRGGSEQGQGRGRRKGEAK